MDSEDSDKLRKNTADKIEERGSRSPDKKRRRTTQKEAEYEKIGAAPLKFDNMDQLEDSPNIIAKRLDLDFTEKNVNTYEPLLMGNKKPMIQALHKDKQT